MPSNPTIRHIVRCHGCGGWLYTAHTTCTTCQRINAHHNRQEARTA